MAIAPGYQGRVTFTAGSGETNTILHTGKTTVWAVDFYRPMVDITSLGTDAYEFSPHAGIIRLTIRGFVDQAVNPGTFNLVAALLVLYPHRDDSGKKETFYGWLEHIRLVSSWDDATRYEAIVRGTGNFEHTWS
jgi:hypothetical protein